MIKQKALFLCTGNSTRTQMAKGLLRKMGGGQFEIVSLGGSLGQEMGIEISKGQTKDVAKYLGQRFAYTIQLCDRGTEPACPIFSGAIYRLPVRDQILRHIEDFVQQHG
jgi:protein-tyrosine-phosphatase